MAADPRVGLVLQARVGSTRLPRKVLLDVRGRPVLVHDVDRMSRIEGVDELVVATTHLPEDDAIVECLSDNGLDVPVFRGSPEDVLDRFYRAAIARGYDVIVRVTSDCPLADPRVSALVVRRLLADDLAYCANNMPRTYPHGLDTEALTLATLEAAWREARAPQEREHVTPFVRASPHRFPMANVRCPEDLAHIRLTLDYPEDLALVRAIYDELYEEGSVFHLEDVLELLCRRPELLELNRSRGVP
jgi:spore coat polysaccharide biosynthesis protein SpsF